MGKNHAKPLAVPVSNARHICASCKAGFMHLQQLCEHECAGTRRIAQAVEAAVGKSSASVITGECETPEEAAATMREPRPARDRLVDIARAIVQLAPGAHFVVCIAFPDAQGIESMGNISTELQHRMVRLVCDSFDRGAATATAPVSTVDTTMGRDGK